MTLENFENIFALVAAIIGLLCCLFKYIELPRRSYLYLIIFFLSHFFSDYYWTIYTLVMHDYPNVTEPIAYLGWNVGYIFLLLAVLHIRVKAAKRKVYMLMFLPIVINVPQFVLYIQFGGVFNNIWQVGLSTLIMVLCMQEIMYYMYNRKNCATFPHISLFIFLYCMFEYGMWTASCFEWSDSLKDPYLYFTIFQSLIMIFFAWAASYDYQLSTYNIIYKSETDTRLQTLIQAVVSYVILGGSLCGYYAANKIKNSIAPEKISKTIVGALFGITFVLIILILILIVFVYIRYKKMRSNPSNVKNAKSSTINFFLTLVVTLVLMLFSVFYNMRIIYNLSVTAVIEDGKANVGVAATDLNDYLAVAQTTLRVVADTVDLMEQGGNSNEEISRYIMDQTKLVSEQFDENFTGLYAYVNGEYIDGLGWVPPEGYNPLERDWYNVAVEANGKVVIVSPYVDAQTGSVVITVAKSISNNKNDSSTKENVVCLDVIVSHIQDVMSNTDIMGHGYAMTINNDGFIVAHRNQEYNGSNLTVVYSQKLLDKINSYEEGSFDMTINGEKCTIFVRKVMDQWRTVIVVSKNELMENANSQLAINVVVSLITFWLISFFYYLGYKNEQVFGQKVEDMNIQMVVALAAAIDAKDTYTNGHSSRVAKYSKMIAERYGYSDERQDAIYMMGLLHDVGKIGVPDSVINKPSKLTDEEFDLIRKHPLIGCGILERIKDKPELAKAARWHHERYGGGGYPDGIAGDAIPEEARIIAVADAYDAMTSRRSYRDVMPQNVVRDELVKGSGKQFDPVFAEIMIKIIDEDSEYTLREIE